MKGRKQCRERKKGKKAKRQKMNAECFRQWSPTSFLSQEILLDALDGHPDGHTVFTTLIWQLAESIAI
jgi:hypothetical protein